MLLIVDANCAGQALIADPIEDFKPVMNSLLAGRRKLAIGGTKLKEEYRRIGPVWRFMRVLDQAGRSTLFSDKDIDSESGILEKEFDLVSDDAHILALARVSSARLLCSWDQNLHADFCNAAIISKPRGKVYQNAGHKHLLV